MKTLVAITAQNRKTIFEHAGKCRNFLVYTIKNNVITDKKLLELKKEEILHNVLHDVNTTSVLYDVDILLTRGIGNGAIQKLAKHNVACYKIEETDPDMAIDKLIKGTLEAVAPVSHESSGCNCGHGHKQHCH
ncbi:MAG: NifB/NifX family molybdenum-iron cluster-binding protein [Lutibacter sp.]|uniref:NifB/NifX family molybdenum-iron cluster-binding protein n=1 Tax=Lutibacter sp. TaxID=1925666 RepID=UPI00299ED605|nr:NifB/NifX family molybdenum-iron cluster-binding protein [Lutibacter sp.]MDX1828044.1 NifB/NifX family molybdenum-iron cluster-binding protein [Lutibacter sp.]